MAKGQIRRSIDKVFDKVVENGGNMPIAQAMREVGYKEASTLNPQKVTKSKTWQALMEKHLSDKSLTEKHEQLLNASRLDHMVFPPDSDKLTDDDITALLKEVNCTVRKVVHGEQARHVYFWASDNKARLDALDMAYKLKAKYPATGPGAIVPVQINFGDARGEFNNANQRRD